MSGAGPMGQRYGSDGQGNGPVFFVEHQIRRESGGLGHHSDRFPGFVV